MNKPTTVFVVAVTFLALGCSSSTAAEQTTTAADTVFMNGRIYTVDPANPWATAVAIKDGQFSYVGADEHVQGYLEGYLGDATQVVDLWGKMAMPGLYDSQVHPVLATIRNDYEFSFPPTLAGSAFQKALREFSARSQDEWVRGGSWTYGAFSDRGPHKSMLDKVVAERPVALWDISHRHLWVNSKALAFAGIDHNTPDPESGEIVRDETGEPTGLLLESAAYVVMKIMPPHGRERYLNSAKKMTQLMNTFGVTGVTDAWVFQNEFDAYSALEKAGDLSVQATLVISYEEGKPRLENAQKSNSTHLEGAMRSDYVKLLIDGVPFAHTAAMLEPYLDDPTKTGKPFFEQDVLNQLLIDFDKAGLTVKMHCAGDAAVRTALDAIEAARKANGDSGLLHQVAHSGLIHPSDIPRYRALNAVAEVSPSVWHADVIHEQGIMPSLGAERTNSQWPIRSLVEAGALVIAGSDWPAAVASPNPWPGIEAMVTRENPYGAFPGALNKPEAIDLETALQIYTLNGAKALGFDEKAGSIRVGKRANMIVVNQLLFEIPPEEISETKVLTTLFRGDVVYQVAVGE